MFQSIAILVTGVLGNGSLTLSIPRITPPGGLLDLDFILMCGLPAVAYFAGRQWHNGPVFLTYGTFGMLTFVPGYLADGRLVLQLAQEQSTEMGHVVAWIFGIIVVATICNNAGRAGMAVHDTGQGNLL